MSRFDAAGNEVDVFSDGPAIVDCDVLEAAKENIQPLASGRRVTALSAILKTPHIHREAKLAEARKRHRMNVQIALEDEDDDPLEAYCRFVYWTLENYPQGPSADSCLLELLEEATRVLKDDRDGAWRSELKYLKLWVLYASYVEKPSIVFKFLLANEIGTEHALLYEEYSGVLERMGKTSEADEIFLLGINRQAEPLDRLKTKHTEFQKRLMTSLAAPPPEETPAPAQTKRPALAPSKSSHKSKAGSISGGLPPMSSVPVQPRPNARPQVFVDPDGSEGRAAQIEEAVSFPDIGTRKARVKENVKEVSKMAGATLKQAGKSKRIASSGAAQKFVPFRDPENGNETESMPPPPVPVNPSRRSQDNAVPQTPSRRTAFVPFRDTDAEVQDQPPSRKPGFAPFRDAEPESQQTPSRRTVFVPFRDGDGEDPVPSTPKFTPYRDEAPLTPSSSRGSGLQDSVMKPKWTADSGVPMSSEAEILRKDPFKNYDDAIKPSD